MATHLPPLKEVERLSPRVIRILGGNPSKADSIWTGTNTYLLGTGRRRTLLDAGQGFPSWLGALKSTLRAERATISRCILTHWHHDHIGGVADLLGLIRNNKSDEDLVDPKIEIFKHEPNNRPQFDDDAAQSLARLANENAHSTENDKADAESALKREWQDVEHKQVFVLDVYRSSASDSDENGDEISGWWGIEALHAPGHTSDHTVFVVVNGQGLPPPAASTLEGEYTTPLDPQVLHTATEHESSAMFTGDAVLGHGTAVFENLAQYMHSLEHVMLAYYSTSGQDASKRVPIGYPAHGAQIENIQAKLKGYIAHRKERERQILDALQGHTSTDRTVTAMQIVKIVYKDVPENLHEAAKGGVLQVLAKLEGEKKVGRVEGDERDKWNLLDDASGETSSQ